MLWSLIKVVLFVVIVAALTMAASRLLEMDGGITIAIPGWIEWTLTPLMSVIAAGVLLVGVWVVLKVLSLLVAVLRFLNGDETAISRYFSRNRERRGFQALADGLMALASGDGREAMTKAARAERYLQRPELTNLITAQAAEMSGDTKKASEVYKELLKDDRTRFVGVRGIMKQKLAEGDTDTALKLAEKAFALKPRHEETQDVLLKLQAGKSDWTGARKTLGSKLKSGAMPRDVYRRRDAVLALSEAQGVIDKGSSIEAREAAIEANRLSPDLIPAAVMACRSYVENGKPRYATRVITKAWDAQPHPDLAAAFAEIVPDENPTDRIKRFHALTRLHPDHPETKMLMAELYIDAEDFPGARRALADLYETQPTARNLTLMAAIERGEGADETVVRAWLTKALTASRGPQWVCDNCHNIHQAWAPVCSNCHAFDSLSWTVPVEGEVAMPPSTGMLPVLVDTPEPVAEAAEVIEPETGDAPADSAASEPEPASLPEEAGDAPAETAAEKQVELAETVDAAAEEKR